MSDENDQSGNDKSQLKQCLLVDDEDMVRQVAKRQLKRLEWEAEEFSGGNEALDAFKRDPNKYELAIIDLNMPKMSGMEVYQAIREINSELPVIMVSGDTSAAAIEGDSNAAMLNKPYRRDDLQQAIDGLN